MKNTWTDITLVVDRSGSMNAIREDAQGGINAFVSEQAQEPDAGLLTLVQFDTEYEFVHRGVPISEVPAYRLHPRGMTALLDAVGTAINQTETRVTSLAEKQRPALVIFVVVTDGLENSSQEFTKGQIRQLIQRQQNACNWHFTFLGANQDVFEEAGTLGINAGGTANYALHKVKAAYSVSSNKIARMRQQCREGQRVDNAFTAAERHFME